MAYRDLRDFIRALEKNNELKRISFEVDPVLEITEFADRAVKQGGPALLFEKPKGHNIPVLINCFAMHAQDADRARGGFGGRSGAPHLGVPGDAHARRLIGKLKMLPKLAEMGSFFPKIVAKGPCQEVIRTTDFSLFDYPDSAMLAGRRRPLHHAAAGLLPNPDTGKRNCGMYRMQVYDERTAGMHWQTQKQGAEHYRRMQHQGRKRMDVAVAIGADPATMYSAILPLPPDLDEMMIAGFLRGRVRSRW